MKPLFNPGDVRTARLNNQLVVGGGTQPFPAPATLNNAVIRYFLAFAVTQPSVSVFCLASVEDGSGNILMGLGTLQTAQLVLIQPIQCGPNNALLLRNGAAGDLVFSAWVQFADVTRAIGVEPTFG